MKPPSATSMTRSTAEEIAVACVIVGIRTTMMAVIGATEKRGLIAATSASGAMATARPASTAISFV